MVQKRKRGNSNLDVSALGSGYMESTGVMIAGSVSPLAGSKHMMYIYAYGVEKDVAKHTHFLTLRAGFTPVRPPSRYVVRFAPQAYYLRMGDRDGTYVSATLTLSMQGLPVSVSTLANRTIRSSIPGEAFLWNVSLHYALRY